jgi:hypothetical protein
MSNELSTLDDMSLANLPEELQKKILEYSKKIQESSTVSINKIRLDSKSYTFPDGTETQNFSGIIIGVKHANIWYKDEYVEGVTQSPACLAVGDASCKGLTPASIVENPPNADCDTCPNFQWGSAAKGKGKACAEYTLLAVYVPSMGDELFVLEQKKANSRVCDTYLTSVSKRFGSPIAVLTQFTMGEKNKWEQSFTPVSPVNSELLTTLASRMEEADDMLKAKVLDAYRKQPAVNEVEVLVETAARPARSR